MSVLTEEEVSHLTTLAEAIEDQGLRDNALSLIGRMTEVIEGVGDRPITWQPTIIKVLQSMSNMEQVMEGGAPVRAGSMVAGSTTIANGLRVIPLIIWQSRSLWDPNPDSTTRLCSSPDAKLGWNHGNCYECELGVSKEEGKPPACNKEYSFLVINQNLSDIYRLTFAKSQYRAGMDWQKEVTMSRTHPYKRVYSLSGEPQQKNKKIFELKAKILGTTTGQEGLLATPAYMAFLAALHEKNTSDRKKYLESYHADTEKRLLLRADGATGAALEHRPEGEAQAGTPSNGTTYAF